ncbi:MAG: F0F1 ATP synthase subunit B [Dysgonamonadaceae bacterium]|jgi:F-type H+-transporting ATPase subunit b|nr:F0F1 ATP synthase subunit B [Dysgonamonadaceae bacterium]
MELFTPDIGLICWMIIPFGVVFFILAKFAWPAIIKGVDKRAAFIDESLKAAQEANDRLAGIKEESEKILVQAREEQLQILKNGADMREQMIKDAKQQAAVEADKLIEEARMAIQKEKEDAIRDVRAQVAELSINIAEKVLRKNLEKKEAQMELVNKLIDEAQKN